MCKKFPKMRVVSIFSMHRLQEAWQRVALTYLPSRSYNFYAAFLFMFQITAWVDAGLDDHSYITPGLGDFGDR